MNIKLPQILILLIVLLEAGCDNSQNIEPNVKYGGRAVAIAHDPFDDNKFIVASATGGLFKSVDGGASWKPVSGTHTFNFTDVLWYNVDERIIIATSALDLRVANSGGIWRSLDEGLSWQQIAVTPANTNNPFLAFCIAEEPSTSNRIWVGTSCGLAYSDNQGTDWSFLPRAGLFQQPNVYSVIVPEYQKIKALTSDGYLSSDDRGATWTGITAYSKNPDLSISGGTHNQLACSPYNSNILFWTGIYSLSDGTYQTGLFSSSDNGRSWGETWTAPVAPNQPSFVRTCKSSITNQQYVTYYSNGSHISPLQRAPFSGDQIEGDWNTLSVDHPDVSDISFNKDGITPSLLTSDGGIHRTYNNGASWTLCGGGIKGYDALEVTDVAGQIHQDHNLSDLYFITQDNNIFASGDDGNQWIYGSHEGQNLNIWRQYLPADQTKLTSSYLVTVPFISGPLFSHETFFNSLSDDSYAPLLLKPGYYIQNAPGSLSDPGSEYSLSPDNGSTWQYKFTIAEYPVDFPQMSYNYNHQVLFIPFQKTGTFSYGIKKVTGIFSNSVVVSDVTGFGSLGTFLNNYSSYVFGVDPFDPNHIIVADVTTNTVRKTFDGGLHWHEDTMLTKLVTQSGVFNFAFYYDNTQVTKIAFDPDHMGHILVGTWQAGVFSSCDYGQSWEMVPGSEFFPQISNFYFESTGDIVVSSYGRGLFKFRPDACPPPAETLPTLEQGSSSPFLYNDGIITPLNAINIQDSCKDCVFFLTKNGYITSYSITQNKDENVISDVTLSAGSLEASAVNKSVAENKFPFTLSAKVMNFDKDKIMRAALSRGYRIQGFFLKGNNLLGLILGTKEISAGDLPRHLPLAPYIYFTLAKDRSTLSIMALGFSKSDALKIYIDNRDVSARASTKFAADGNALITLKIPAIPGNYTVKVEQTGAKGTIAAATVFSIPHDEDETGKQ